MAVEMNKSSNVRLTPVQEIKLAKPATELYVGQILKTVVVTALTNNQVLININGHNLNANSSHHFTPGELLDVKVIANSKEETILEVQPKDSSFSILQKALLATLPRQAPATELITTLNQLLQNKELPTPFFRQIKAMLGSVISLSQLSQQLPQGILQSGTFLESLLFQRQRNNNAQRLRSDFKGQCLKLLQNIPESIKEYTPVTGRNSNFLEEDHVPLPGTIPQPLHKDSLFCLLGLSFEELQSILKKQLSQVIARITTHQINHLTHDSQNGFLIRLDLPLRINEDRIDIIPLMIKQHKAGPMHQSKWSLSFALSLSRLGDLQATISLSANKVDLRINVEHSVALERLNEYHNEIRTQLEHLGLSLQGFKLQLGLDQNHIDSSNLNLLDIRI